MGGSSLSLVAGGGGEGNCDGFCSALGSTGGDTGTPGGGTAWRVGSGKPLFPLEMGGRGREFGDPTNCGGGFPGGVGVGRVEGMGAPCVGVDGPLAEFVVGD